MISHMILKVQDLFSAWWGLDGTDKRKEKNQCKLKRISEITWCDFPMVRKSIVNLRWRAKDLSILPWICLSTHVVYIFIVGWGRQEVGISATIPKDLFKLVSVAPKQSRSTSSEEEHGLWGQKTTFKSQHQHLLALWLWVSDLPSLRCSCPLHMVRTMLASSGNYGGLSAEHFVLHLASSRCSIN